MPLEAQTKLVEALRAHAGADDPSLTPRERALLAYADQVTRSPVSTREQHIAPLRAAGLDDRAIHDACAVVAYFAFVNRIADGLGVELEDGWRG